MSCKKTVLKTFDPSCWSNVFNVLSSYINQTDEKCFLNLKSIRFSSSHTNEFHKQLELQFNQLYDVLKFVKKMSQKRFYDKHILLIFFPFKVTNIHQSYFFGNFQSFDHVKIFFVTNQYDSLKPDQCMGIFTKQKWLGTRKRFYVMKDWAYGEIKENVLLLKKLKINGVFEDVRLYQIVWINYNFKDFSQCEIIFSDLCKSINNENYLKFFKEKIHENMDKKLPKKVSCLRNVQEIIFNFYSSTVLKLSYFSSLCLPVTKYFNIALHIDNYLSGFVWALKSIKSKKKFDTKVINFLLSILMDMLLGIIFLNWLNSKVSLDSFPKLFLVAAESIINSIKEVINWLRGDPAGLKLNWAFNKVLAMFFSFHIDIWWTFIAFLNPIVKFIFQFFLKLGLLGMSFQASILADLLALVSFHIYCIYAYAARLYSIQISSLISLWRLFLGRKKNPLRGKVDSCRYSPEQLFVGTLGFTILLFLLPTTLLYYVVFTCIRLSILMMGAILMLMRYLSQTLPVYSTFLWVMKSPKVSAGLEIIPLKNSLQSNFLILTVNPITHSWWETVTCFTPEFAAKPSDLHLTDLISSTLCGKLIYPI